MGVDLSEIIPKRKTTLEEFSGKSVAIDGYNALYQFLAIIRQPDGTPLKDRTGRATSHLSGILYRSTNLIEKGIRLAYVFDGEPPELKEMEIRRRRAVKEEAAQRYEAALKVGKIEDARKYAQATSQLKDLMVSDSKRLLDALGIPWIQAPSEGEAQASFMASQGEVWAAGSQDHDCLLFGAPRILKNLTITGRRKLPGRNAYVEVEPEVIELSRVLSELGLTREQLIDVGILVGTDFNPDGVRGIGPKTAVKLIKEHGSLESIPEEIKQKLGDPEQLESIRTIFLKPKTTSDYSLRWKKADLDQVVRFLCGERDFSEERVRKAVEKMQEGLGRPPSKSTLESYFA